MPFFFYKKKGASKVKGTEQTTKETIQSGGPLNPVMHISQEQARLTLGFSNLDIPTKNQMNKQTKDVPWIK